MKKYRGKYTIVRSGPGVELEINGEVIDLAAGKGDDISLHLYAPGDKCSKAIVAILSTREGLGYAGMELLEMDNMTIFNEAFIDSEDQLEEISGRRSFWTYGECMQASLMAQLL